MKKLNREGVSLAELLAVVVIMGIIAAIAIPLVGNVIETSKKKAYLGDLTTVAEAARTYCIAEGKSGEGICGSGAILSGTGSELEKYISKSIEDINNVVQVKYENNKYLVYGDNNTDDTGFTTTGNWIDVTSDESLDLISKKSNKVANDKKILDFSNKLTTLFSDSYIQLSNAEASIDSSMIPGSGYIEGDTFALKSNVVTTGTPADIHESLTPDNDTAFTVVKLIKDTHTNIVYVYAEDDLCKTSQYIKDDTIANNFKKYIVVK